MEHLRSRLLAGETVLGIMISEVRNPNVAYMLARCGFDFLILDNEHGSYCPETIGGIVAAARGAGISVVVRVPEIRREVILKPLDLGAAGLLVPQVHTAEQARQVIQHAKYPPMGNRGVGLRRAHSLYERVRADEYLRQANEHTFIAVQAESPQAVENLEEIASVPGVDSIFVGPIDLSVSLGIPGQVTHPREVEAIQKVIQVCDAKGIVPGIHMFDLQILSGWVEKGMRFVTYSSDINLLADAASEGVARLKELAAAKGN